MEVARHAVHEEEARDEAGGGVRVPVRAVRDLGLGVLAVDGLGLDLRAVASGGRARATVRLATLPCVAAWPIAVMPCRSSADTSAPALMRALTMLTWTFVTYIAQC